MRRWFPCSLVIFIIATAACNDDGLPAENGDFGVDMHADLSQLDCFFECNGPGGDLCQDILDCVNMTTTNAQATACIKRGTKSAQATYRLLSLCIDASCPVNAAVDGGLAAPCDYDAVTGKFLDQAACDACVMAAQTTKGACASEAVACQADGQ